MGERPAAHGDGRLYTWYCRRCLHRISRNNVGINRCRIGHVTKTCIIRIHGRHGAVIFKDCRFANLNIGKLHTDFYLARRGRTRLRWRGLQQRPARLCCGSILRPLDANSDSGAGGARCGTGRAGQIKIRRSSNTHRAGSQNRLWNFYIHKMVEGGDLVIDNLALVMLIKEEF